MSDEPPGCLLAFLKLFGISPPAKHGKGTLPYQRKQYLLSNAERAFFDVLQDAVGERFYVFAKIRLADLIEVPKGTESWKSHFNKIQAKHLDFVLCDPESVSPMLAIELDDVSHQRQDRRERDVFVDEALRAAGLPLLRIKAASGYNRDELRQSVRGMLSSGSAE